MRKRFVIYLINKSCECLRYAEYQVDHAPVYSWGWYAGLLSLEYANLLHRIARAVVGSN
jgi:hypothetical protein